MVPVHVQIQETTNRTSVEDVQHSIAYGEPSRTRRGSSGTPWASSGNPYAILRSPRQPSGNPEDRES
eukprot:7131651-Pyramimonas_sp.AAC.2